MKVSVTPKYTSAPEPVGIHTEFIKLDSFLKFCNSFVNLIRNRSIANELFYDIDKLFVCGQLSYKSIQCCLIRSNIKTVLVKQCVFRKVLQFIHCYGIFFIICECLDFLQGKIVEFLLQ